jgi:uncharacterized membrane protein
MSSRQSILLGNTSSSPDNTIGGVHTAVPLIQDNVSKPVQQDPSQEEKNRLRSWQLNFFCAGIGIGIFLSGLMYGSLGWTIVHYGENPALEGRDYFLFTFMWTMSHIRDISYILMCLGFGFILTRTGSEYVQRLLNETSEFNKSLWDARSVFLGAVIFEGAFLLGSSCTGLVVEMIIGVSLSIAPFACAIALDLVVCILLIGCYDWGMGADEPEEAAETAGDFDSSEKEVFIAIV